MIDQTDTDYSMAKKEISSIANTIKKNTYSEKYSFDLQTRLLWG